MAVAILGSAMAFIDSTAVNVLLPVFQRELDASITQVQWIMEGYALFISSLILFSGALGDKYGRRKFFIVGAIVFSFASVLSGLAQDINALILSRMFQGVGGALLVPGSLALINISFDDKTRGKALGVWSAFTALTAAIGPIVGGWLAENVTWRLVFFLNLPIFIIVILILLYKIKEDKTLNSKKLDILGSVLISGGLGLIIFGLIESSDYGLTDPIVLVSIPAGILGIVGFLFYESRIDNPILPLHLFKSLNFRNANIISFLFWATWNTMVFFIPFCFIQVFGYTADKVAISFVPALIALFIFSPISGFAVNKIGVKVLLIFGNTITAAAYFMFTILNLDSTYLNNLVIPITLLGIGFGLTVPPLVSVLFGSINKIHSGVVSGINNSVGRIAGLFAIALLGVVAVNVFNFQFDSYLERISLTPEIQSIVDSERVKLGGFELPDNIDQKIGLQIKESVKLSFLSSFKIIMFICSCLAIIAAILSFFALDEKKLSKE
ncbi:MAG: MFS transporter [Thermodesulfobacteriota bacterium]